jgi:F-box protein 18 (helicase)
MSPTSWTNEQEEILSAETEFLLIKAFAGTGKTTVLAEYTRIRPAKSFLYTSFNSQVIKEALESGKFESNTTIQNIHSYAYGKVGFLYKHKLNKDINPKDIIKILMLDDNNSSMVVAKLIKDVISQYCYSHIKDIKLFINTIKIEYKISDVIKMFSEKVWAKLVDPQNDYKITHDVYLKVFCNTDPVLNYDYILFDEAQDANDALKKLFVNQIKFGKKVIFTGDLHQSIYSFRGTKNILKSLVPTETKYLTCSFRFGKNIANIANKILMLKSENKMLIGSVDINDLVGKVDFSKRFAVIARSNAGVLSRALNLIGKNKKIYFIGGLKSYDFYKAQDVEHLYHNRIELIKSPAILRYNNFKELIDNTFDDKEISNFAQLVLSHKGNLIQKLNCIEEFTVTNKKDANVIITNVHRAKGLEFNQVVLANDFFKVDVEHKMKSYDTIKEEEELNIIYVAITRAKIALELNENLKLL